jgi:transcription-repair coupling factor (superfamily II helicase)
MARMTSPLSDRDRTLLFGPDTPEPGEAVVHFEHGLARWDGETEIEVDGETQRFITLVYRNGGKLMLPADEARDVWRYGAPAEDVTLDRLRAGDWVQRRDEMIAELREGADHLLAADRARRARHPPACAPDAAGMARFAEGFPHRLTEDQTRAVQAVLDDMAAEVPMNRLLIGDVGFGKTEVALRAAAAAVLTGHQAALVAPTTILARQHADEIRARMASIGAEVVELSRLTGPAERRDALARLASGEAAVAVGTSSLLSEDVAFAALALVLIDEEQKFGTEQKARLRRLTEGAHVLGMTATPIPRSLALAEVGLLDLSVVATPPEGRLAVETRVAKPSAEALCEAVTAERARGGQVYVVCPRVAGLDAVEAVLRKGGVDFATAHGQLDEDALEDRMERFRRGEVDVLLATSIVESGLDAPRANAMVVLDPEMFGLAQLHQLRGRIGRGDRQAQLLLLTEIDMDDPDDDEAAARLRAFLDHSALGCGFEIARRDRDLRGFGELDGEEQAGHTSRLGIGLYRHVLREKLSGRDIARGAAA